MEYMNKTPADPPSLPRDAEISTTHEGDVLGACLFLSKTDLKAIGIDVDEVDHLTYELNEGGNALKLEGGKE
ncbi:hypothetical protein [Haloarchaeobius sp. HRN-SO-5]|uniref:hypothetical protein n=1 Tax=Haloarchaeobius sp. HRN-SO-5 TaxID=3446118 RepID=UPI003EBDF916